ncbi:hypothetical protein ACLB2K_053086 [Fragaria x ananassa]
MFRHFPPQQRSLVSVEVERRKMMQMASGLSMPWLWFRSHYTLMMTQGFWWDLKEHRELCTGKSLKKRGRPRGSKNKKKNHRDTSNSMASSSVVRELDIAFEADAI